MKFVKMQGIGNDFIIIEDSELNGIDAIGLAKSLCERHFGIGADGLILVCSSEKYDARMRIINSDGSEAEMCGNGIRCFAKYIYDRGIVTKKKMEIETLAGVVKPEVFTDDTGRVKTVKVDMGKPNLDREKIPVRGKGSLINEELTVLDKTFNISSVNTGVPHTVIFTDDIEAFPVEIYGPKIEKNDQFPYGTNVNFAQVVDRGDLKVRTWERGAGLTLACGSGACAAAYISHLMGYTDSRVQVSLPGGDLFVEIEDNIYMTGPCEEVFSGYITII
ncbi:MAG: diaminopimelate epimerase [Thermoanaerobacteraceae bacterium]|nr:diaminopimelate epimerase [Thermoanaerobacteraceae bacterium]